MARIEFDDRNFQKNKKKGKIVKKIYFEKISMVLSKWWLWARIMILVHKKNHDLQYNSTLKKSRGEKLKKKRKKASSQSLKKLSRIEKSYLELVLFLLLST